ncbi:MAG: flagellar biosynthesis anti-sigma factor FlgM [Lachnospiraceae bacterium]|nr:flagellar biosynthesis anti-sigma factor FlgM [Lachnospiraceae bacterium]
MRIDAYNQISQVYGVKGKVKTTQVNHTSHTDKLEISSFGRDMQIAKQAVNNAPDVRMDKAEQLKNQIQNGTYDVDVNSFADMLLQKFSEI